MATEKRLIAFDPITFESFTRHATKHREAYDHYDMGYVDAVEQIENWMDANTVDAVEVVNCCDCKKCVAFQRSADSEVMLTCTYHTFRLVDPTDYCVWGERKDNG